MILVHGVKQSSDQFTVTTDAADFTGVTGIIVGVGFTPEFTTNVTVTDTASNVYTGLTQYLYQPGGDKAGAQLFYCAAPTVTANLQIVVSGDNRIDPAVAFVGIDDLAATPFDQINGVGNSFFPSDTLACGSITPSQDGELVVATVTAGTPLVASVFSIDSGLTISDQAAHTSNANAIALATLTQMTAAAINPTWTTTSGSWANAAASVASFKLGSAPPVTGYFPQAMALAVMGM